MRGIIRLLPLSIVLVTSREHPSGYVITGHLTGFPDSTMVYLQDIKRTIEMKGGKRDELVVTLIDVLHQVECLFPSVSLRWLNSG
jgi:hypothetical protein